MAIKNLSLNPKILMALGIMLSICLAAPLCFAGGAVKLVPAEDQDVPDGSYIPKERIEKIEKKVTEHKAKMKEKAAKQEQQSSQKEAPKTKAPEQ